MKKIKCLILDNEVEAVNRLESLLLKLDGVEVLSKSTNSLVAIKEILTQKPDLVFTDIEMPHKTGFEIVKEVRENQFFPSFVFVTTFKQYAIAAIKKAAFDYLLKPVNIDELKHTIERYKLESVNHKYIDLKKCPVCNNLSEREREVLFLIIQGDLSHKIADKLFISKATVDFHRKNILLKTGSNNFVELCYKINKIEYIK